MVLYTVSSVFCNSILLPTLFSASEAEFHIGISVSINIHRIYLNSLPYLIPVLTEYISIIDHLSLNLSI